MRPASGSRSGSRTLRRAAGPVVLALVLAACPGDDGPPGPGATKGREPDRGGELVVAYPHEPATLNPFVTGGDNPATRDLVRPLMPALYRLGPGGAREPWLLEREPLSAEVGGTPFSVRLRLRADAKWSDGRPITAGDLRFTWQAVMASSKVASKDGYDRLSDVLVESPTVARLVFKQPFARWRDLFSAGLGVLPAHALGGKTDISAALGRSWPVSGGPFVLKGWTPGLELVFDRNPNAWGGGPLLDRIRIQFVPDPVTALQMFERGLVDVVGPYAGIEMARRVAQARRGATVTRDRGATWVGLFLNVRTSALSDVRVRRALALSLDRQTVVEGLVREQGMDTNTASGGDPARTDSTFRRYDYRPAEAERLLDAAGWRGSGSDTRRKGSARLTVTLASVGSDELNERVLRALNAQAGSVGIDLNLVSLDADRFWGSWLSGSRFQAGVVIERDPPGGAARARFGPSGAHNISRLSDQSLRSAFDTADATLDDAATAVDAPWLRLSELVPVIPLYVLEVTLAARPGVFEVVASASADGFLWDAARWWREGGAASPAAS